MTQMTEEARKKEYFALMARFCQLGRLLPSEREVCADADARARGKLILAEMAKTQRAMDALRPSRRPVFGEPSPPSRK